MTKGYVKWALTQELASDGDEQAALVHLKRVDPLLRGMAERRFQSELLSFLQTDADAVSGRPILLGMAKAMGIPATPKKKTRAPFWWATSLLTFVSIAALALVVYQQLNKAAPFTPDEMEDAIERADAYQHGGRPLSLGDEGKEVFGESLPSFVIALDRHSRKPTDKTKKNLDSAEAEFLDEKNKAQLGPDVFTAMQNLALACHATLLDGEGVSGDVDELNAALVKRGLSYYIDSDLLTHDAGASPLLYSHFVENVRVFNVGGEATESVYWLRRLDSINYKTNMLGSTHRGATAAVIRRDLINEEVHENLLPALGKGADFALWSLSARERVPELRDELEAQSGVKLRADFSAAGTDLGDAASLAALLVKREQLFGQVSSRAQSSGYNVAIPTGYRFDMKPYRRLEDLVGKTVLRKLSDIDETLGEEDMALVYKSVRRAFVRSVEFHELQHRLDYMRKEKIPDALSAYLRPREEGEKLGSYSRRVVTEYSAYMAQIANSDLPFVVLVLLSQNAFNQKSRSSVYMQAAVAVIESLCDKLGIVHEQFVVNRTINRLAIAKVFVNLLEVSPATLQTTAKAVWEEGFDTELIKPALLGG